MKRVLLPGLMIVALGTGSLFAAPGGANPTLAANTGQTGSTGGLKPANSGGAKTSSGRKAKKSKKKHHKKKHHKKSKKG